MSGLVKWMQSYNVVQKKLRRISLSTLRRGVEVLMGLCPTRPNWLETSLVSMPRLLSSVLMKRRSLTLIKRWTTPLRALLPLNSVFPVAEWDTGKVTVLI